MINQIELLTFSPTSTSRAVANAIAQGTGIGNIHTTDLTHCHQPSTCISSQSLAIITAPVYGGKIAPTAISRLQNIGGNGAPAVVVAVYGNRHYENALNQLAEVATELGFIVIAAATFIGEHSYSSASTPIAVGRPDDADLANARNFGKQIIEKLSIGIDALKPVDVTKIETPHQPEEPMARFKSTVMQWMQQGLNIPKTPEVNELLCSHCGACVDACPVSAISLGNECLTDANLCIKCCACVKQCPSQARKFNTPFAQLLADNFAQRKECKTLL